MARVAGRGGAEAAEDVRGRAVLALREAEAAQRVALGDLPVPRRAGGA